MTHVTDNPRMRATARDAGANVVHTVYLDGVAVATRRSATNRYRYAIAHWSRDARGVGTLVVSRWSSKPNATGSMFAIRVDDAKTCAWFARCGNEATTTRSHPILGDVPICDRCDAKVAALS